MYSVSSNNDADSLFKLEKKVDESDDVETLLRTTKRFIGSKKGLPSTRLDIQKLSEFDVHEDTGLSKSVKVFFK